VVDMRGIPGFGTRATQQTFTTAIVGLDIAL